LSSEKMTRRRCAHPGVGSPGRHNVGHLRETALGHCAHQQPGAAEIEGRSALEGMMCRSPSVSRVERHGLLEILGATWAGE
jgi:hypothetical protein